MAVARDVFAGELHLVASFLPGDLSPDQSEKGARELSEGGKTVSVSVSWSWGRRTRVLEQAPRWVRSGPPGNRDRRRTRRRRGGPLPKRPSSSIQARSPCTHLSRGDIHFKPTLAKREGTAPELGGPISHAEVVDALDFLPSEEDRPLLSPPLRGTFSRDAQPVAFHGGPRKHFPQAYCLRGDRLRTNFVFQSFVDGSDRSRSRESEYSLENGAESFGEQ